MSNQMGDYMTSDLLAKMENKKLASQLKNSEILNKFNSVNNDNTNGKRKIDVLIDGMIYTLVSEEDESYMQKVAFYINQKILETKKMDSSRNLDLRAVALLTSINITDEYFKVLEENKENKIQLKQLQSDADIYKEEYQKANKENELLKAEIEKLNLKLLKAENNNGLSSLED